MTHDTLREHLAEIKRELERADLTVDRRQALEVEADETRRAILLALADDPRHHDGDGAGSGEPLAVRGDRDRALRVVERLAPEATAGDRLCDLIEHRDRTGRDARYLVAVAAPAYERAFAAMLREPQTAHLRMSREESEAVRAVSVAMAERALTVGGDAGYGVPASIDPTIIGSSDGAVNPLRALASRVTISTDEHRAITGEAITATFSAEGAEASDDTPDLAQPVIRPERLLMFVPVSFEAMGDWGTLQSELGRLFADAQDTLEAEKLISGAGHASHEPEGLIAGLAAGSVVETASASTLDPDDVYALQEALGARFQPRAVWLSSLPIANIVHRYSSPTGDEPPLFSGDRSLLLGKPWHEASTMATAVADAAVVALYGDLQAAYRVVDRLGLTVELVPHLVGTSHLPTGQRGLVAWARVGGGILADNAVRALKVKVA